MPKVNHHAFDSDRSAGVDQVADVFPLFDQIAFVDRVVSRCADVGEHSVDGVVSCGLLGAGVVGGDAAFGEQPVDGSVFAGGVAVRKPLGA